MMSTHNDKQNKRYRKKYHYMKLQIKSLIFENAALCDEVAKIQENIQIVKDERRFLLCKLLEFENDVESTHSYVKVESKANISNGTKAKPRKRQSVEDSVKNI